MRPEDELVRQVPGVYGIGVVSEASPGTQCCHLEQLPRTDIRPHDAPSNDTVNFPRRPVDFLTVQESCAIAKMAARCADKSK